MKSHRQELWFEVPTRRAFLNITPQVEAALHASGIKEGLCLVGRCTSHDHCPAPLTCQQVGAEVEGLGVCR